jgi:hypothetical protein
MHDKHEIAFTDEEFETLHILVHDGIKKLDSMPRVDLMEPSRKQWLKIMETIKRKLSAEASPGGLQLGGFQLGRPARVAKSVYHRKQSD